MKVLHVSSAKSWRGGEQQIAYLLEELATQDDAQQVFCPVNTPLADFCKKKNIGCTTYKKRFSVNPLVAQQLAQLVSQQGFDIVHLHDSHAHTFACMAASGFGMKTPMVLHRRVDFPVGRSILSKWKYNHSGIKAMTCVSCFVKSVLCQTVKDKSKVHVVHSGVDLNRFLPQQKNKLREEFQVPADVAIVANVAAITEQKDYPTFIRTAARLVKGKLPVQFFIIGEGKQRSEMEEMVAKLDLKKHIIFTGFREDITEILPNVDVLLFTSQTEGLGTTLLDAQLCGVPIVATNVGGIPEIVVDGKSGLLAAKGADDALAFQVKRLLTERRLRNDLIKEGKERVRRFSKKEMAEGVRKVYERVLLEDAKNVY